MKLTVNIIKEAITDYLEEAIIPDNCDTKFEMILWAAPGLMQLQPGRVYVVTGDELARLSHIDPECLLICKNGQTVNQKCPIFICKGDLNRVYEAIIEVFGRYSKLEDDFSNGLLNQYDLSYYVKLCAHFFRNRVQVFDPAFSLLDDEEPIFDCNTNEPTGFTQYEDPFTAEAISEMYSRNDLQHLYEMKSAQIFETDIFIFRAIILNLFEEDAFIGRLDILESITPFTEGTIDTVNIIGKYFKHVMQKHTARLNANLYFDEYFLSEIIKGQINDDTVISKVLSNLNLDRFDLYALLYIHLESQDKISNVQLFHIQSISVMLKNAKLIPHESSIIAIIKMSTTHIPEIIEAIEPYLQKFDIYAGLSEPFGDLLAINDYFEQARFALSRTRNAPNMQHLFCYTNYAIDHIVGCMISNHQESIFIHPAVRKVAEYDKKNNTMYLETLKAYLQYGWNNQELARILHIHRNSAAYRIDRLKTMLNINLEDSNERLRLALSIRAWEMMEIKL